MEEKTKNSFVFYRSFRDSIHKLPKRMQYVCMDNLIDCCLGLKSIDDVKVPYNAIINEMVHAVNKAEARYEKAKEQGKLGGRPAKKIDREEAERLYKELGSWRAVSEKMGISEDTMQRLRDKWKSKDMISAKPQNLNKNINTNIDIDKSISIISKGIAANNRLQTMLSSIPKERVRSEPYVVNGRWFVDMIDDEGRLVSMGLCLAE